MELKEEHFQCVKVENSEEEGFISEDLKELEEVCKDVPWFEMCLRTYFTAQGSRFHEWIQEYSHDWSVTRWLISGMEWNIR